MDYGVTEHICIQQWPKAAVGKQPNWPSVTEQVKETDTDGKSCSVIKVENPAFRMSPESTTPSVKVTEGEILYSSLDTWSLKRQSRHRNMVAARDQEEQEKGSGTAKSCWRTLTVPRGNCSVTHSKRGRPQAKCLPQLKKKKKKSNTARSALDRIQDSKGNRESNENQIKCKKRKRGDIPVIITHNNWVCMCVCAQCARVHAYKLCNLEMSDIGYKSLMHANALLKEAKRVTLIRAEEMA